ncbi:MAG: hypothetical protein WBB82_17450 [Limnothrix sp.]
MAAEGALKLIEQAAAEGWTELDLSSEGLTEIPEQIAELSNLTSLNLWNNQITEIPEAILNPHKLENLYLIRIIFC